MSTICSNITPNVIVNNCKNKELPTNIADNNKIQQYVEINGTPTSKEVFENGGLMSFLNNILNPK